MRGTIFRPRTLACFGMYVSVAFAMAFVHQVSDELAPLRCDKYDVMFELLPDLSFYGPLSNAMANTAPAIMCATILAFAAGDPGVALRRWFVIMGILYAMRGACLAGTMEPGLPDPEARFNVGGNKLLGALRIVSLTAHSETDLMFSGHTCSLLLSFLLYLEAAPRDKRRCATVLYMLYTTVGILSLSFARLHYTNDCCVAFFLTFLLHRHYSEMAKAGRHPCFAWVDFQTEREAGWNMC